MAASMAMVEARWRLSRKSSSKLLIGDVQLRKGAADSVEIANGVYIHAHQIHHADAYENGNERAGDLPVESGPQKQHCQADQANQHRFGVDGGDVLHNCLDLIGGFYGRGACWISKPQQVFDLTDNDGDRDACGKARSDGIGNEANKRTKLIARP